MASIAPYPVGATANFFIRSAKRHDRVLTHLKLQKLVYLSQGFHLSWQAGTPLFLDPIEAWDWGPVVPVLYHEFKTFGALHIDKPSFEVSFNPRVGTVRFTRPLISREDDVAQRALRFTWKHFSEMSPGTLVRLTHRPGSPWHTTYIPHESGREIKRREIKRYFDEVLRERQKRGGRRPTKWFH